MNRSPERFYSLFDFTLKMMNLWGFSLFENVTKGRLIRMTLFIFGLIYLFFAFAIGMYQLSNSDEPKAFVDLSAITPICFMMSQELLKIFNTVYCRIELRDIVLSLADIWTDSMINIDRKEICDALNEDLKLIQKFSKGTLDKLRAVGLVIITYFCSSMYILMPLTYTVYQEMFSDELTYLLPYNIYTPFEINSLLRYLVAYAIQMPTLFLYFSYTIPAILLMIIIVCVICALFRTVKIDLTNALTSKSDGFDTEFSEIDRKKLSSIIVRHQKLLSLSQNVKDIFGFCIFASVCSSSLTICCFVFASMIVDKLNAIKNIFGAITVVIYMFNYSWPGQLLCDRSNEVAEGAYKSEWYKKDTNTQRCIRIIIMRSNKPCYLSALGFYNLTIQSFSKGISGSLSLLSLFRQVYLEGED